jgi:hypothetical protein
LSDITGVSGIAILDAILAGEPGTPEFAPRLLDSILGDFASIEMAAQPT